MNLMKFEWENHLSDQLGFWWYAPCKLFRFLNNASTVSFQLVNGKKQIIMITFSFHIVHPTKVQRSKQEHKLFYKRCLYIMKTELRKTEQQIQNASFKHFTFLRVCIIESQTKYSKVIPKWNSLFIICCKIIFGIGKLLFWFFFLLATVGITLPYIKNKFSSLLFLPFTMKAN